MRDSSSSFMKYFPVVLVSIPLWVFIIIAGYFVWQAYAVGVEGGVCGHQGIECPVIRMGDGYAG